MSVSVPEPTDSLLESLTTEQREVLAQSTREEKLLELSRIWDCSLGEALERLAAFCHIPVRSALNPLPKGGERIPLRLIQEYKCLPLETDSADNTVLHLASCWPPDSVIERWVYAASGQSARWFLAQPEQVTDLITQQYGVGAGSLEDSDIDELAEASDTDEAEDENAAIIRFINEIVIRAIEERATDIHFEPQKETLQIRYRIDGQLDPVRLPENLRQYQSAIISRLKIMARMNISERRRPQDGRIAFNFGKDPIDIRISTLPTMYGESVSLRLLNQKNRPLTVKELGLMDDDESVLMRTASRPHGIILVTGPTGSGKSTTLTAVIRRIHSPERRIMTVEDPVEYEVPGVNQTQVHADIGLDFAAALRTVLRQDPDVIMVGEIRDRETADIAIRASLTGHLVLSTLHTNDSAGALTRLTDMGIEPFLIASSIELIVAQRLVRRLNREFASAAKHDEAFVRRCLQTLGVAADEAQHAGLLREPSPPADHPSAGFRGRLGVFEMLPVSEEIHQMIVNKQSAREMRRHAIAEGMRTLQQCAWEQCKNGMTTLGEIMRLAEAVEN